MLQCSFRRTQRAFPSGDWLRHNKGWSIVKAGNKVALEPEYDPNSIVGPAAAPAPQLWKVSYAKGVNVRATPETTGQLVAHLEGKCVLFTRVALSYLSPNFCVAVVL